MLTYLHRILRPVCGAAFNAFTPFAGNLMCRHCKAKAAVGYTSLYMPELIGGTDESHYKSFSPGCICLLAVLLPPSIQGQAASTESPLQIVSDTVVGRTLEAPVNTRPISENFGGMMLLV